MRNRNILFDSMPTILSISCILPHYDREGLVVMSKLFLIAYLNSFILGTIKSCNYSLRPKGASWYFGKEFHSGFLYCLATSHEQKDTLDIDSNSN